MGDTITKARANELLVYFANQFGNEINSAVGSSTNLKQQQFDALVSFTYNLGPENLKKSTLLAKVKANPNDATIRDEFMKWIKAGGKIQPDLKKRREAEADLYFS